MLQDKVWVWSLGSGIWSLESGVWGLESGIWSMESGVWRGRGRLELSAVSKGGTEGDLISKGEINTEWKSTG